MSFLTRLNAIHMSWRYFCNINVIKTPDLRLQPVLNLLARPRTIFYKSFSTSFDTAVANDDVKKYLNYITDLYKYSKLHEDETIGAFAKSRNLDFILGNRLEIIGNIESLKDMATDDKEMEALRMEEVLQYQRELEVVDDELVGIILKNLDNDSYNRVIMEISAGVGGTESMIFANDLLNMYVNYLNHLQLEYEIMDYDKILASAIRGATILITSPEGFSKVRYEGGIHRVQRVPATERNGRIHTSTVSVAIYPEPSEIQVQVPDKDIRIETMRASGAGGQHVNTTDSAVRIIHIPTGIAVTSQQERSQRKNKEFAMLKLRTRLYEQQLDEQVSSISSQKKQQIGNRTRNEKIRTYNYPHDRITDHRMTSWKVNSLKLFMENPAPLAELQTLLQKNMQRNTLLEIIRKSEKKK